MSDGLTKHAQAVLAPVERDESIDRIYIPLPGGWEVQTKGLGSSFRIADTKSGQQWTILDASHPDQFARDKADMFERMAMEIRAAYAEQQAEIERLREISLEYLLANTAIDSSDHVGTIRIHRAEKALQEFLEKPTHD